MMESHQRHPLNPFIIITAGSTSHAAIIQLQTKDFDDYDKMHLICGLLEYQIKNSDHQEPPKSTETT